MESLAASSFSSSKIFSQTYRNGARPSSSVKSSTNPAIHLAFSRKVSGESLCLRPLRSVPITVSAQTEDGEESVNTQTAYRSTTTVHVRFLLQKECMFGENFYLIGEDQLLGVWDPSAAIPMDWSNGHIWCTEMDIPVGTTIQFKFILKGLSGEIEWQPGPDRILQTWETKNTVVVSEDWYSAELQKIAEESMVIPIEESGIAEIVGSNGKAETLSVPVLVIGLSSPSPILASDGAEFEAPAISVDPVMIAVSPTDKSSDHNIPEHEEETAMACRETAGKLVLAKPINSSPAAKLLRNGIEWSLRTLSKLIQSLGF